MEPFLNKATCGYSTFSFRELTGEAQQEAIRQVKNALSEVIADDAALIDLIWELKAKFREDGDLAELVDSRFSMMIEEHRKPSPHQRPDTPSVSEMLTPSEIGQLRQEKKELADYNPKAFAHLKNKP